MGELRNFAESINRGLNEIYKELWEQREKLGSLMISVKNLAEKAEKAEEEKDALKKQLEIQQNQFEKEKAELMKKH